jgi:two-component sensor histidine kinase
VHRPGRRGFGTKLLEGALADQLEGEVLLDFAPAGLSCAIEFPLGKAA